MPTTTVPPFPGARRQRIPQFLGTVSSLKEAHSDQKHGRSLRHVIITQYFFLIQIVDAQDKVLAKLEFTNQTTIREVLNLISVYGNNILSLVRIPM